jgi:tripartite-type tricarboxylate transporter receptor subunit TctC
VTIVVPFAAGGGTDIIARMLAQKLEQRLGKSFVIENRPGAGSTTGAAAVARAMPDGYTLLMAPSPTMAVAVTIYKNLPYDPVTDFVPLALAAQTPFALVVNPSLPIRSVSDLIRLAKERPGQFSYGSAGPGTPHHLYAELFKSMTGIEMSHVPYRGSGPLLNDVVGGHLPLTFVDFPPAVAVLQTGQVRAIGISTRSRLASFPDIPPIADTVPGFDAASWQMLVAPARTPRPIVDKLHAEVKAFLPELQERILNDGMLMMDNPSVEALQEFVKSEIARWGRVAQQAGLAGTQ